MLLNVTEQNIIQAEKHICMTDTDKKYWRTTVLYFTEFGVQIGGVIQAEKQPSLLTLLNKLNQQQIQNYKDHSHTAFAFTDDIVIIEDYVSQTSFIDIEKDNETIQAIEKVAPVQTKIFTDEVKINSKVQVKYVNNGRDISIHIVSTENNKNDKSDGFQKVYYKVPLAHSLLGQTVGDIVKVGELDNFVEILKITN